MQIMISALALQEKLAAGEDVLIVDCRFDLKDKDYGRRVYETGHLPGAYYLHMEKDLSDKEGFFGGSHPFLTPEAFGRLLESLGAKDDTLIVAYDEGDLVGPSRFFYQGLYAGLYQIRMLEGGIQAWQAIGGALSQDPPAVFKEGHLTVREERRRLLTQEEVKARKDLPGHLLIDSRSHERYLGKVEPVYTKAGHIPGAKNYFFMDIVENGGLKERAFLEHHFQGLDEQEEVILSCGSGVSACVNAIGLLSLGIEPTLYNGSFSDWIADEKNPVVQGEA